MKNLILCLLVGTTILLPARSTAANNLVRFSVSTAAYSELSNDTDVTLQIFPDSFYAVTALNGKVYNLLGQNWSMDTAARSLYILPSGRVFVGMANQFALFDVLYNDSMKLIDASSKVSYVIEGKGGPEVLKVQWKNLRVGTGPVGNFVNMQMWLYRNGLIEFRYGPRSANNASGYNVPKDGVYVGLWYSTDDFASHFEKMNLSGTPPAITVDSAINLTVPHLQGVPDNGTLYRFTPKTAPTSVSSSRQEEQTFEVYPIPADKLLYIRAPKGKTWSQASTAYLFDLGGKQLAMASSTNSELKLNVGALPAGSYQLIIVADGRRYTQIVSVEK
jgi:hypothetical protein